MNRILKILLLALSSALLTTACSPDIGSEAWCKALKEKPKGDWSSNEAADYTKHCLF
ncbi:DUF3012 domain-containing protein [Aestuariirhabdus sp. LZHN29]|uniref:DUF3012 domain-containing protein n=1 Tax=Aestuariirhabdus sp. LZHN29 TaxID=3417462 RepID=UPI003CE69944